MGALLSRVASWVLGGALKWGTIGSVVGGVGKTVLNGQDITAANLGRNTISSAKDIAGFTGEMAKEVIAPTPAPAPQPQTNQQSGSEASGYDTKQGAEGQKGNLSSKIMGIFNNFSDMKFSETKLGRALAPAMEFLRSSPIISGIITLVGSLMGLSGSNSGGMRVLGAALAGIVALNSGIFESVTQGSGRNTPAVGGADSYYAPPRSQPHVGGEVTVEPESDLDYSLSRAYRDQKPAPALQLG